MPVRTLAVGCLFIVAIGCDGAGDRRGRDAIADSDAADATTAPEDAAVTDARDTGEADATSEASDDADGTVDEDTEAHDADVAADGADAPDGADATEVIGSSVPLDPELVPCEHPEYWPFSVRSEDLPLRVHYRMPGDAPGARESLAILEYALGYEVDRLGFDAPLDDGAVCGPDGDLDVFTWRDAEYPYVDVWGEDEATPWDDGYAYMVMDPWGEFGGDELAVTLAHELNHACQASYDWSESTFLYEATSTFVEDEVYDDSDSYQSILFDFQGNPDWSLDRDDDYETWYMYGAMLYLRYLRDRFFKGDGAFISDLWRGLRSAADDNEPDWIDSLDALLADKGRSFADTLVEFARWRWYVAERDDGLHLEEAGAFPDDARPRVAATIDAAGGSAVVRPMMLGSTYVDVSGALDGPSAVVIALDTRVAPGAVQWVVQALPGDAPGSDGEVLALPAEVALLAQGSRRARTLVVTALPGIEGDVDPEARTDERFEATLRVSPVTPAPE